MGRPTLNKEPAKHLPNDIPRDVAVAEFGRRLQRELIRKGWNQNELAIQASKFMPEGNPEVSRGTISKYINGKALPSPVTLAAVASALGVEPEALVATRGIGSGSDKAPELDVRDVGDGQVWLRVNKQLPWPKAMAILNLLKGDSEET